jgi:hypothetical protein
MTQKSLVEEYLNHAAARVACYRVEANNRPGFFGFL